MRGLTTLPTNTAAQHAVLERAGDFLNFAKALVLAKGDTSQARAIIERSWPKSRLAEVMTKAVVNAGRTDGTTWGDVLAELRPAENAFLELARSRSVLGALRGFRSVPLNVRVPRQLSGALVGWTAEGAPTMASAPSLDNVELETSKITGMVIISLELARLSDPKAQALINNDLIEAVASFVDQAFLDPTIAAAGDAPAAITNGATAVTATGTTEAALKADVRSLIEALEEGGSNLERATLAMSKRMALSIAQMSIGEKLGLNGGTLLGLPVVTSTNAAFSEGGSPETQRIVALDPSLILLGDEGVEISASQQGSIQMSTTPDSPPTASTALVSLWQNNLVAAKIVRYVRFERARDGAAAYITGARYAE